MTNSHLWTSKSVALRTLGQFRTAMGKKHLLGDRPPWARPALSVRAAAAWSVMCVPSVRGKGSTAWFPLPSSGSENTSLTALV